jgi:hypothetical protein
MEQTAALEPVEVEHLWWFADGAIMQAPVRRDLWRSWGLCGRHAWAYAVTECELRYQPLGAAILYLDLLERALRLLGRRWLPWPVKVRGLRSRGTCPTCVFMTVGQPRERFAHDTHQVNRRDRYAGYLAAGQKRWAPARCPACGGGSGQLCRPHLVAGAVTGASQLGRDQLAYLADVARRLEEFKASMIADGPPLGPDAASGFIEAIGFVAGWEHGP